MNGFKTLGEFPLKEGVAHGTDSGSKIFGISLIICLLCLIMNKYSVYCGPTQSLDVGFHCSETFPQPSLCLVLAALCTVRIHCPVKPTAMPGPILRHALSVCTVVFASEVLLQNSKFCVFNGEILKQCCL